MPQIKVIFTESAEKNILQVRDFYSEIPEVGMRAIQAIKTGLYRIADFPNIGRPNDEDGGETRLLFIGFGASGYVVKYRLIENEKCALILGVRSFKQAGFHENE